MKILLTNDDGYDHPGIKTLYSELSKNHEVFMMAPNINKSGFGSALTFLAPLKERKIDENIYCLDGTPVDCIKTSLNGKSLFELDLANLESENTDNAQVKKCNFYGVSSPLAKALCDLLDKEGVRNIYDLLQSGVSVDQKLYKHPVDKFQHKCN